MQRLWRDGVVRAQIAVVDPAAAGRPLTMIVTVEIDRRGPQDPAALDRWLAAEPAVQQAWQVAGDADYTLVVTARDAAGYRVFLRRLVAENPAVVRCRSGMVLETVKRGLAVPVEDD